MTLSELPWANNNFDSDTLIIALHGLGGSGVELQANVNLDALNATVIYPTATLNEDGLTQWRFSGILDAVTLLGIREYMIVNHSIDPTKVFLYGQSNGGVQAYDVAHLAPDRWAGVVTTGAFLNRAESEVTCRVTHIHGVDDDITPYSSNTPDKIEAGGVNPLFVSVYGAGHDIPSINAGLAGYGLSISSLVKEMVEA